MKPDFDRGTTDKSPATAAGSDDDFEQRLLELAYSTTGTINVPSVAYALKLPTAQVSERLEDLAARDVLIRDVDDGGNVFFKLPGQQLVRTPAHPPLASAPPPGQLAISPPADDRAVTALVLNVLVPGAGSLVAGRVGLGLGQLILCVVGVPLCFLVIGIPMVLAAWIWSLVSGIQILEDSKRRQTPS